MYNMFIVIGKLKNIIEEKDGSARLIVESKALPNEVEKKMTIPVDISKELYKSVKERLEKDLLIGAKGLVDGEIKNDKLEPILVAEKITLAGKM